MFAISDQMNRNLTIEMPRRRTKGMRYLRWEPRSAAQTAALHLRPWSIGCRRGEADQPVPSSLSYLLSALMDYLMALTIE